MKEDVEGSGSPVAARAGCLTSRGHVGQIPSILSLSTSGSFLIVLETYGRQDLQHLNTIRCFRLYFEQEFIKWHHENRYRDRYRG